MTEYIEREAAQKVLCKFCIGSEICENHGSDCHATTALKAIPAADVVEVVHASWIWNPDGMDWGIGAWVCGKCKSRPETWWNTVKECHPLRCAGSRYCGNCGVRMDGGQDKAEIIYGDMNTSTSNFTPTKRMCRQTGQMCEFAGDYGYCKITACVKRRHSKGETEHG